VLHAVQTILIQKVAVHLHTLRDTVDLPSALALGKGPKTLGKHFAECNTRHTAHGIDLSANNDLPSVFYRTLGKWFVECQI